MKCGRHGKKLYSSMGHSGILLYSRHKDVYRLLECVHQNGRKQERKFVELIISQIPE